MMQHQAFGRIGLGTAIVLLIPLILTLLNPNAAINGGGGGGWDWTPGDFVVMGALIFGMGCLFVLTARRVKKNQRFAVGIIFLISLMLIWAQLAVGIFDFIPIGGS